MSRYDPGATREEAYASTIDCRNTEMRRTRPRIDPGWVGKLEQDKGYSHNKESKRWGKNPAKDWKKSQKDELLYYNNYMNI